MKKIHDGFAFDADRVPGEFIVTPPPAYETIRDSVIPRQTD